MGGLNDDEAMLVATVREFVDKQVRPTVREREHANEYPEAWIQQMKRIGIYGLAEPEEYGGTPVSMPCYVLVTQELARGWMGVAGAMGGHTVVAKLLALLEPRSGSGTICRRWPPVRCARRWRSPSPAVAAICRTCRPPRCPTAQRHCRTTMSVFPGRRPGCCPLSNASRPCERGKVAPISTCN